MFRKSPYFEVLSFGLFFGFLLLSGLYQSWFQLSFIFVLSVFLHFTKSKMSPFLIFNFILVIGFISFCTYKILSPLPLTNNSVFVIQKIIDSLHFIPKIVVEYLFYNLNLFSSYLIIIIVRLTILDRLELEYYGKPSDTIIEESNEFLLTNFELRCRAYLIDFVIMCFLSFLLIAELKTLGHEKPFSIIFFLALASHALIYPFLFSIYFSLWESSRIQSTPGKYLMGLKVCDLNRQKLNFWKSLQRNLAKILSGAPLYLGFLMCSFTKKRMALHDILTKTIVIKVEELEAFNKYV